MPEYRDKEEARLLVNCRLIVCQKHIKMDWLSTLVFCSCIEHIWVANPLTRRFCMKPEFGPNVCSLFLVLSNCCWSGRLEALTPERKWLRARDSFLSWSAQLLADWAVGLSLSFSVVNCSADLPGWYFRFGILHISTSSGQPQRCGIRGCCSYCHIAGAL